MRVLLTSTPGAGHLGPLFPFAHALRRAGHEVLVAAPVSAQARVERAGLAYLSFADPLERDLAPTVGAARARARRRRTRSSSARSSPASAPAPRCPGSSWRSTPGARTSWCARACEFAGAIAAEARGIPHARVGVWLALTEDFMRPHRGAGARGAARVGRARARPEGARLAEAPYLTLTPPSLEAPDVPCASRARCASTTRRRARTRCQDPGAPPLVYVRFGTVDADARLLPRPLPRGDRRARRPAGCASS